VRGAVLDYLARHNPVLVGSAELREIRKHVLTEVKRTKPVSDRYLLSILLETSVEVDRAIGGLPVDLRRKIPVGDLAACKRSLIDLARQYSSTEDLARATDVRRAVRRTREHLDLALARASTPGKLSVQRETLQWLRAWLENPPVFEAWVEVRERTRVQREGARGSEPELPTRS
jgi:hypothetical protein